MSANPGTITAAPNFAYALCAARVSEQDKLRLRLDTVTTLIDGAEPVRSAAIEKFRDAFAGCGLRPEAHRPSYGLAEATVFVSASVPGQPPARRVLDRARLAEGQAVPAAEGADGSAELVSCGSPIDQDVAIVDPETRRVRADGEVGEIWVSGPNVGHGYWGQPEETARTFHNQLRDEEGAATDPRWWLRTGDLGVRHDGELFVTGRIKDMIIVDGRNHYPHDIELTVEHAHAAIRRNNTVAFTVSGKAGEQAVVLAELARTVSVTDVDEAEVRGAVRAAVSEGHGLALRDVLLVPADSLPRTSSGKIARFACRDQYLTDDR
jgi:acyl-CoA synthetase (AMP-forming)/AMP-acid ligase II